MLIRVTLISLFLGHSLGLRDQEALRVLQPALQTLHSLVPSITNAFGLHHPPELSKLVLPDGFDFSLDDLQCIHDINRVVNGTIHFEMWALKMIDSVSKIPSGILEGNLVDLGQFDECVEVQGPNFMGEHCLVSISLQMNSTGLLSEAGTISLSQCFPSTCSITSINNILAVISKPLKYVSFSVAPNDCHTNQKSPLDSGDWIMIVICCGFAVVAIISTAVDYALLRDKKPTKTEMYLKSFSLYTNGTKLFSTEKVKGEMSCINGIKFISMAWVMLGHKYMYALGAPNVNLIRVLDFVKQWTKMFIINGTMSVDTFFVISGLLNAYGFFTLVERQKTYNIFHVLISYIHRFVRLTPPFMIMVGITATFLYRLGDGPFWDRTMLMPKEGCVNYWWYDLLYIADYKDYCMDQSWYLGADMQMFWLSPILLYPMWRWPVFGLIWFFIILLGAISIPFALSYSYAITTPVPLLPSQNTNPFAAKIIYLPAHVRLSTYIIGIMTGYLMYKIRKGHINFKPHKIFTFAGWLACGVCLLYPIYGGYWFYQEDSPYSQLADSFFIALFRPMWGIGVSWVIIACATGHGGIIDKMLSLRIFRPLGRLTYCSYLTHIAIIKTGIGLSRVSLHLDDYRLVQEFFGDMFYSLCTAAALSLLVESPTMSLEKLLLGDLRPPTRKEDVPNTRSPDATSS